jgi:hypothetical protein
VREREREGGGTNRITNMVHETPTHTGLTEKVREEECKEEQVRLSAQLTWRPSSERSEAHSVTQRNRAANVRAPGDIPMVRLDSCSSAFFDSISVSVSIRSSRTCLSDLQVSSATLLALRPLSTV